MKRSSLRAAGQNGKRDKKRVSIDVTAPQHQSIAEINRKSQSKQSLLPLRKSKSLHQHGDQVSDIPASSDTGTSNRAKHKTTHRKKDFKQGHSSMATARPSPISAINKQKPVGFSQR